MDEKIEITEKAVRQSAGQETAFVNMLNEEMEMLILSLGYRKESDTSREIFEKIFEVLCCFTTQGKSKEYAEGFIDCLEEVDKRLQNLAKEKYGVDLGE